MAELLKQQVVVDNRGGAAGNIGVEVAVRANPDGYNFLLGNVGTMAINPVFYTEVPVPPAEGPDPASPRSSTSRAASSSTLRCPRRT